jgi:mRNA-degrading endonuclease RelE of RelBE toxin-antitoxin system
VETITLKVNDSVFDKFQWLLSHFSKNEIDVVNAIDCSKLSLQDFDYISIEKMNELKQISSNYKNGERRFRGIYALMDYKSKLAILKNNPYPNSLLDIKKLSNSSFYRLRINNFRFIYEIGDIY